MELLTLNDVNLTNLDTRFKQSAAGKLIGTIFMLGFCVLFVMLYFKGELELLPAIIFTAIFLLLSIYTLKMFIKNIGPDSWNLAVCSNVILIKFRSFFNSHFPETDPQIVSLDIPEIKSAKITKQKLKYKTRIKSKKSGNRVRTVTKFQTFLDITVNNIDLTSLEKQLDYEHKLKCQTKGSGGKSRFRHFPVRVIMPDTIRLEWFTKNTQLKPGITKAVETLEEQGICFEEMQNEVLDCTEKSLLDSPEIDKIIYELGLRESKSAAVELAVQKYGYDRKEAKNFVEYLLEGNSTH